MEPATELICWRCERHGQHKGHNTELLEDVSPGYREKLQEAVRKLRQLEEECTNQKAFMAMQIAQWKESEEERILQRLRVSEADLDQQSRQLESHILELEERCQGSAQKLLQDVKGALSRSQAVRLETPEALVLEIETECDVPEVYFDLRKRLRRHQGPCEDELPLSVFVWDFLDRLTEQPGSCETDMEQFAETLSGRVTTDEALQELVDLIYQQATSVPKFRSGGARLCNYLSRRLTIRSQRGSFRQVLLQRFGVTLDPETAHPELILSQDQRQVTRGPQGDGDLSPWRFMALPCILGRQSFAAGRQYFEVDVGEGTGWDDSEL
ncbi:Tripartite motif-containing protein 38 [Myotis davidii]|uniref:Tripartite motif-containing protein 38 n=1 Tax=Myotis davidii TaxID=225400 RepID=L5M346_MYODS|nr:Tripartite motif-containing protein 38 [Myotis davidii]